MKSLSQTLFKSIQKHSNNMAFNIEGNSYSYSQLMDRAAHIQTVFLKNHETYEAIGIVANQDFDTYSTIIAAILSGITYIPIEPSHPDERNNFIIKTSKLNVIFCSDLSSISQEFSAINKHKLEHINFDKLYSNGLKVIESNNPAYVLFTSGSTGVPKGVPISMKNLEAFVNNVAGMELDITETSRFLQVFDLTFDLSVFSYLVPLLYGASVFTQSNTSLKHLTAIQLIKEQSITHILTVPSFVSFLKPYYAKIELQSVSHWLFCGEALKYGSVTDWQKCIPNSTILNVYGPTEATIFCTYYKCPGDGPKEFHGLVSIGKPFNNTVFYLFDGNENIIHHHTIAELCISGSQLTSGYIDEPMKNKSAFFEYNQRLVYRSGDLCQFDEQGDYFFTGRNDTQVKVNGYRIEISEIEYHARDFPGIDESLVIVSVNKKNDQQLLNLVYTAKSVINQDEIISFLSKRVPSYMLPVNIYYMKSIPYNLNGKVDKNAILAEILKIK